MTDEEKVQALVGARVTWVDLDGSFLHIEVENGLMFHIRIDTDEEYEAIEVNGDLPN